MFAVACPPRKSDTVSVMKTPLTPEQLDIISEYGYFQNWDSGFVYSAYWDGDNLQLAEDEYDVLVIPFDKIAYDKKRNLIIVETEDDEIALLPLNIVKNFFSK
jgi:hypothetical protein